MVVSGSLSPGSLVVFVLYLGKMYKPMQELSKMVDTYSKALVGYERIQEVLETDKEVKDRAYSCSVLDGGHVTTVDAPGTEYRRGHVIMTDGRSDSHDGFTREWQDEGHEVPIFGVTFGDADASDLDALAELTRSRVFDGRANLTEAFRSVRGYN